MGLLCRWQTVLICLGMKDFLGRSTSELKSRKSQAKQDEFGHLKERWADMTPRWPSYNSCCTTAVCLHVCVRVHVFVCTHMCACFCVCMWARFIPCDMVKKRQHKGVNMAQLSSLWGREGLLPREAHPERGTSSVHRGVNASNWVTSYRYTWFVSKRPMCNSKMFGCHF